MKELSAKADAFFQNGEYEKAEECLLKAVAAGCGFADVYNKLGLVNYHKGYLEKAAGYFEEALRINPKYTEVSLNLSITYNELGQYNKAREVYGKAKSAAETAERRIDPFVKGKLANMHFETGEIYYEMGLFNEAIIEYSKALTLRPDFADVKVELGIAYREKGLIEKAVNEFKEAKMINPNYAAAGINLGITYYSISKFKQAEEEWLEVLKKHPGNKTAEMYLRLLKKRA